MYFYRRPMRRLIRDLFSSGSTRFVAKLVERGNNFSKKKEKKEKKEKGEIQRRKITIGRECCAATRTEKRRTPRLGR